MPLCQFVHLLHWMFRICQSFSSSSADHSERLSFSTFQRKEERELLKLACLMLYRRYISDDFCGSFFCYNYSNNSNFNNKNDKIKILRIRMAVSVAKTSLAVVSFLFFFTFQFFS
jgi:hypothetical protein